jgi:hypothetical protein
VAVEDRIDPDYTEPPRDCGWVYVVRCDRRYVKVGRTKKLRARLCDYFSMNPGKLELLEFIVTDDAPALESRVHSVLRKRHHRGEWFEPFDTDIAAALEVLRAGASTLAFADSVQRQREVIFPWFTAKAKGKGYGRGRC